MSAGGLSKARLSRMHDVMTGYVERGEVPGIVTLVSRRGDAHVDTIGVKALGGSDRIGRDTIFRIASLTKPIAAAAAMILVARPPGMPPVASRRVALCNRPAGHELPQSSIAW